MSAPAILADGLVRDFGPIRALDHLSLEVRRASDVERPPIATIPAYRERVESLKLAAAER